MVGKWGIFISLSCFSFCIVGNEHADFFVVSPAREELAMEAAKFLVWMQGRVQNAKQDPIPHASLIKALKRLPELYSKIHDINDELAQAGRYRFESEGWQRHTHKADTKRNALVAYLQSLVSTSNPLSGTYWAARKAKTDLEPLENEIDTNLNDLLKIVVQVRGTGSEQAPLLTHSRSCCLIC